MEKSDSKPIATVNTIEVFNPAELIELCNRIKSSGVLGRSKYYGAMLDYLVSCSIENVKERLQAYCYDEYH